MEAPTWSDGDTVVIALDRVVLHDELADLRFQFHKVVLAGVRVIIVDAAGIDTFSSQALGAMLTAHRACRRRGGHIVVRHAGRRALDQLQHTGLCRVFAIEPARHGPRGSTAIATGSAG